MHNEKLGAATIASKIMTDIPGALSRLCERKGANQICQRPELLSMFSDKSGGREDKYLWTIPLSEPPPERIGLRNMNRLGLKLLEISLRYFPAQYITFA